MAKYTEEQIAKLIEKEEKRKETQQKQTARYQARLRVMKRKAEAAGITVTEKEILEEMAKK